MQVRNEISQRIGTVIRTTIDDCYVVTPDDNPNHNEHWKKELVTLIYPVEVPDHFEAIAAEWHRGQNSALYSVSSTGYIHNRDYQIGLESELESIFNSKCDGCEDVADFLKWVQGLPPVEDD